MIYRFLGLILLISSSLSAQQQFFSPYTQKSSDGVGQLQKVTPTAATYYVVSDPADLAKALQNAPLEDQGGAPLLLELPNPDGKVATFRITRYQMISDKLQARYPHYVTAFGWDVTAPHRKIFLEWTDLGFGASVTGGAEGRWYVAPKFWQRQDLYQSYYTQDYPARTDAGSCGYAPDPELMEEIDALGPPSRNVGDCTLREYDLAIACTGEYYAAVGGTEALVVAEIMTAINRVNEVFRSDLAITLKIINLPVAGGGIELVFDNPVSDPYDNDSGSTMLGQNQTTVDAVIGSANYDIGHVFSTGGGGIATLNSPCSSQKAQGVTGLPNPTGDPFYIDFVAHEIGHQFGGRHTFNSFEENCTQRSAGTAYEPGSGTTIQAYAGICGPTANVQLNSDPYYHAVSIQEISGYMELGGGATCATVLSSSNGEPSVNAGADYIIPANTPFVLTATGSDGDGDALTYCWEQFDLGPIVPGVPTGNETLAPLFRSLPPVTSPQRFFPNLPDLVASGSAQWEVLPKVAREMNFTVTLRDFGAAGYGCTVQDQMEVEVVTSTGFAITAPNGGEVWQSGNNVTVTWDVAGTGGGSAVNCANVELVLSTDGGLTFDQVLATVANTGSATIMAPAITETDARLMIRCSNNIFFDISNADFSIEQTDYSYTVTTGAATVCNGGSTANYAFILESLQGYTGTINYTAANLPSGASINFMPTSTTLTNGASETVTFTLSSIGGLAAGDYTFQVVANDGSGAKSEDYVLTVKPALTAPTGISPGDGATLPLSAASFTWSAVPAANNYRLEICSNAAFTNCFTDFFTTNTGVNFGNSFEPFFTPGQMAFWRVVAIDDTCAPDAEAASPIYSFTWVSDNSLNVEMPSISVCEGQDTDQEYTLTFTDGAVTSPATLSIFDQPSGLNASIHPTTVNSLDNAVVSLSGEETLSPGSYTITVRADDGMATEDLELTLTIEANAITVNTPVDGEDVLLTPNMNCPSNRDGASFVDFNFAAYTGGGTVVEYLLYISVIGSGSFNPFTVTPGMDNNIGLCLDEGAMLSFYIEAELTDGSLVRSCDRIITATENPLPIEWLSFTAAPLGKTSLLQWSVVQDEEHRGFTVEKRMEEGVAWENIAQVTRMGEDGQANYRFTDTEVRDGNTYFYRLRQEDLDGSTAYSDIRSVTFSSSEKVVAFPNPTSDQLNVSVSSELPDNLEYQLFSALGQPVSTGRLTAGRTTIDLTDLPPAIYQLVVTGQKDYREVIRVVRR